MLRAIGINCVLAHVAIAEVSKEDAARATALFEAGRVAIEAGKIDEACARFEQSLALDPQVGTRMNLADCREKQNRLVEAYQLYEYGAADAEAQNKPGRLTFARQQLERLATSLVRITLHVTDDSPGLTVQLTTANGTRELPPAVWSRTVITEPGAITIDASAPDRKPIKLERQGEAGAVVEIEIPTLESTIVAPPPPPAPPPRSRTVPLIVVGASAVVVGAGVAVAVASEETGLGAGMCVVGAVGLGVGAYLYVKARRSVAVAPTATATSTGVSIVGVF